MTPTNFNVDFENVHTVEKEVVLMAPLSLQAGSYTLTVGDQLKLYGRIPITITDGDPDFTVSATLLTVTVPPNVMSSDVQFTVSSVNGFDGPVKVTWVSDGAASPSPTTNDFTGTVTPTAPFTFTRKMYRFATHSVDIPVTFTVTDVPFTKQRSVTINVKQQP